MKRYNIGMCASLLLLFALLAPVKGTEAAPRAAFRHSVRALSMGGAFITNSDDLAAIGYNPASLSRFEGFDLIIPGFSFGINDKILDVVEFVENNQENLENFDDLQKEEETQFRKDFAPIDGQLSKIAFSPLVGIAFKHFGVSVYGTSEIGLIVDQRIYEPRVSGFATSDVVTTVGYGQPLFLENLDVGVALKHITRREADLVLRASEAGNAGEVVETMLDEQKKGVTGYGLDVGVLYRFSSRMVFAGVIQDFLGSIDGEGTPFNLKVGGSYRIQPRLMGTAEVHDFLNDDGTNLFTRIHMGVEYSLPILALRAGFNQGYPCLGFGINLKFISLDYAYFGEELGEYPGQDPQNNHLLAMRLGWR
ncbi:MAG: hypothetical protein V1800_03800 [Candidatus Latescibacterota bacterium]